MQLNDTLSGLPQTAGVLPATGGKQPAAATAVAGKSKCWIAFIWKIVMFLFLGGGNGGGLSDADADLQARLDNLRREWFRLF